MKSLMTILFFAAGVALLLWVARPMWSEIVLLRQDQADISATLASLRDLQKLRDEFLATYNSIPKDKMDRLVEMVPPVLDTETLLANLEKLVLERGMKLQRIDFLRDESRATPRVLASPGEPDAPALRYGFTVAGTYEALRALLSALEKNLRVVDVTALNFAAGKTQTLDIRINARSYYQEANVLIGETKPQ